MGVVAAPVLLWTTIAAAAVQTAAAIRQNQAVEAAARRNAATQRAMAKDAELRAEQKAALEKRKTSKLVSVVRSRTGKSGFLVDEGSPFDIVEDAIAVGELEYRIALNNGGREAFGYTSRASIFEFEADVAASNRVLQPLAVGGSSLATSFQSGAFATA